MSDKSELWGDWAAYFEDMKAGQTESDREDDLPDEPITVLEPGRELSEIEVRGLKGSPGSLIKRLIEHHWDIRVGHSVAQVPATLFVDSTESHNRGDVRYAAYVADIYEVLATKRANGGLLALHCHWKGKDGGSPSLTGARTYDPILGLEWRPRAASSRPQLDWEAKEGVAPPMGFTPWLKIVAPTKAELKKKHEAKEAA